MRVQNYSYLSVDINIICEFLDNLEFIGELNGKINPSFFAGEIYSLPCNVALQLNEEGYCIISKKT